MCPHVAVVKREPEPVCAEFNDSCCAVKREPEPVCAEFNDSCCALSGVMMLR